MEMNLITWLKTLHGSLVQKNLAVKSFSPVTVTNLKCAWEHIQRMTIIVFRSCITLTGLDLIRDALLTVGERNFARRSQGLTHIGYLISFISIFLFSFCRQWTLLYAKQSWLFPINNIRRMLQEFLCMGGFQFMFWDDINSNEWWFLSELVWRGQHLRKWREISGIPALRSILVSISHTARLLPAVLSLETWWLLRQLCVSLNQLGSYLSAKCFAIYLYSAQWWAHGESFVE